MKTEKIRTNLIKRKALLVGWTNEIDRVIHEIAVKGTASASISAAGGSKSYTRIDLASLRSLRKDYGAEIVQIRRRLDGTGAGGIRRVYGVRC